jgi:histidinol phosphatase-like PHP family hydrolase
MKKIPQDLHIHTVYSIGDGAVAPQMTIDFVASIEHADIRGISDHFEYLQGNAFESYSRNVRAHGFYLGCEINSGEETRDASEYPYDYFIYHCRDKASEYRGAEFLVSTGKPVIISHPMAMGADLSRVPRECFIEINNRYVWRGDYMSYFSPWTEAFHFVFGSDAHQPNWLSQTIARKAGQDLGITESLLFSKITPAQTR